MFEALKKRTYRHLVFAQPVPTAHVVLGAGVTDVEQFRQSLAALLADHGDIEHATLQVERTGCNDGHLHAQRLRIVEKSKACLPARPQRLASVICPLTEIT